MSQESQNSTSSNEQEELPIERGFPIEQVNQLAEKEARGIAKRYYRPIYTMHKWWARRLGCVFRTISLYTLLDSPEKVEVFEPGENSSLDDFSTDTDTIANLINQVDMSNPDTLWELYPKDVRIQDKKILDPFMGGGTSLVEASRFGASVTGGDLNPVSWFISKKELETGSTDLDEIEDAYEELSSKMEEEVRQYYKTPCPHGDHHAEVICYFWVKELDCVSCDNTVSLFNDYRVAKGRYGDRKGQQIVLCPDCQEFVYVDNWQSECTCTNCGNEFSPKTGNITSNGTKYSCGKCGQKYGITDAVEEQNGYNQRLVGLEYYCEECKDNPRLDKGDIKGYRATRQEDLDLYEEAVNRWANEDELKQYTPNHEIRPGWKTAATDFEGSAPGGGNLSIHGISSWDEMFNERQLLCLSQMLKGISELSDETAKEFLLLSFSDALRGSTLMTTYQTGSNAIDHIFKSNSFDPPKRPAENNPWGASEGSRNFERAYERLKKGIEYGNAPYDRYPDGDEIIKSPPFGKPVGEDAEIYQGDIRDIEYEDEFDAVITDPPYYHNVMYSELADYFYVWQRLILKDKYEFFEPKHSPRKESIVSNPAEQKDAETFEQELRDAFRNIKRALKDDGILTFTYHHSDSESWGELLEALCHVGFEITASYPITADLDKLEAGESVSFDIIVVARPRDETVPISWNSLRREIYRTARRTRQRLEESRDISRGDIGVMEMGECFREYSKHHGKVQRDGEIMSAKEVVQEIYGIIQEASDIGVEDVFVDLLDSSNPSFDDVNKLCRGTNATPEDLKSTRLYNQDDGFELGTWDNEKRQAYIQERVNGDGGDHLSNLDKLQFLRYRYEKGQAVQNYVEKWDVDDDMRELAGRLADVTGDDTYTRVLGDRDITSY
ncbi:DUF1156 domain-containing protein [Halonotius pteroides]|uniref:DNA methyltransferase n=1 Tax=Halonotius pteroides TaxID=268735 RepID=A0A3A6Q8R6_9EURY|nr:DUF1156 domain-containing protein [Halonotius pteroides]RJX50581.1 DNA methyltransferase [Halonotius pteroides]